MIQLKEDQFGWDFEVINLENRESILIQTDWDYPAIASNFGWNKQTPDETCSHHGTDGTIPCPDCEKSPTQFITEALEFLSNNDGAIAEDPGYF